MSSLRLEAHAALKGYVIFHPFFGVEAVVVADILNLCEYLLFFGKWHGIHSAQVFSVMILRHLYSFRIS